MGLDLTLRTQPCGHCGRSDENPDFNYTYNTSKMWREATNDNRMVNIDGMTGEQSIELLTKGLAELRSKPAKYKKMNPTNGWGDYDTFCEWIATLIDAANKHPNAVWESWR